MDIVDQSRIPGITSAFYEWRQTAVVSFLRVLEVRIIDIRGAFGESNIPLSGIVDAILASVISVPDGKRRDSTRDLLINGLTYSSKAVSQAIFPFPPLSNESEPFPLENFEEQNFYKTQENLKNIITERLSRGLRVIMSDATVFNDFAANGTWMPQASREILDTNWWVDVVGQEYFRPMANLLFSSYLNREDKVVQISKVQTLVNGTAARVPQCDVNGDYDDRLCNKSPQTLYSNMSNIEYTFAHKGDSKAMIEMRKKFTESLELDSKAFTQVFDDSFHCATQWLSGRELVEMGDGIFDLSCFSQAKECVPYHDVNGKDGVYDQQQCPHPLILWVNGERRCPFEGCPRS